MNIELLTVENVSEVATLFDEYRCFYNQDSNIQEAVKFLEERLSKNESIIFAAKMEDDYVGFVQMYSTFSSVAMKRAFILNDLYVAEDFRRYGVAEKLINQAFQHAAENDSRFITLETGATNLKAQALYEKMGMSVENDVKHYIYYW